MILTQKNQSTLRQTCPSATMSTTNSTCTDLGLNPGPHYERSSTKQWHGQHRALREILWFVGHIYCCVVKDMNGISQFKMCMKYKFFLLYIISDITKFFSCFGFLSSSPVCLGRDIFHYLYYGKIQQTNIVTSLSWFLL